MDIDYLLLLQNFRETTRNVLSPFLLWFTDIPVGFWPFAAMLMVYWVFDRKAGRRLLSGFALGVLMNGFLKLIFRITRPWLRDARVVPYGNSIVTATGYSFPSGHTTYATALYCGIGLWQWKRNRAISIVLFAMTLVVMFSRNYLGVHTPQDVLVAFFATLIMMFIASKAEDWTDKDPRRDWIVMGVGILLSVAACFYYNGLTIEKVYDATGAMVVDPRLIKADSYEGAGALLGFSICRFFERRYFDFDTRLKKKDRFILCVFALIPLYWWWNNIIPLLMPYGKGFAQFVQLLGIYAYAMIIVPLILQRIRLPRWMREEA